MADPGVRTPYRQKKCKGISFPQVEWAGVRWEVEGGRWEMGGAVEGPEEELRVSTG